MQSCDSPMWPFLVPQFKRMHFFHSAPVAHGVAEVSGKEGLDQFPGER